MLKRNIILLFAVLVTAGSVNAQVRPGIKIGYNLSGVMADYIGTTVNPTANPNAAGDPDNFKMKSGFQIGMIADWPINDAFAIQPGVRFTMQGFTDKYNNGKDVTRKFSLFYLQVPVYAQYKLNIGDQINVLFQAGPYLGCGLFGRQSYTKGGKSMELSDDTKKIKFGNGTSDDIYNAFDYGVGAGVGIEVYHFQLMAGYDFGLYKMTFDKSKAGSAAYKVDMRNNCFSVTLAYIFGRKDPLQNKE